MITSIFQKPIEFLSLNGSSGSLGYVILPVKIQFIVWLVLFGHKFPGKASRVKGFYLDIGQLQSQTVKYILKGRKKKNF